MAPLKQWLKPPRTLLLSLFLLTLVAVSALGWFGWRILEQERLVTTQRQHEQLEQVADRIATAIRGTLAETGDRLGAWESAPLSSVPVKDSVLLLVRDNSLAVQPEGRLLYYPFPSSEPEANSSLFAEAEMFEFVQSQPLEALQSYEKLAASPDAAIRAGALLRMARVLRAVGREQAAYTRLAAITGVRVAGAPAELIARLELCRISKKSADALMLRNQLLAGRWHLTRGQFSFYWSEVANLSGIHDEPPSDSVLLSEAAARVWETRARSSDPRGEETIWIEGHPFFFLWRGTPERRAVLMTRPDALLNQLFSSEAVSGEHVRYAVVDAGGRVLAGEKSGAGRAAVRTAAESRIPWNIRVSAPEPIPVGNLILQQRYPLLGMAVMVLFLILGTHFIARAIRREADLLRMQSDFVSAVSHEFRSPLTSMRQLSEILAFGRAPSDQRRQLYYETLVKETTRLQRVVEALLNFGRMEAGARQYHFEELDAAALVRRVVSEFEPQAAATGRHIAVNGTDSQCLIDADPDAICVALRNLLDNAIKYSPGDRPVSVEWSMEDAHVAIKVHDEGLGVHDSERKAIFQKFVRGTAARTSNAKGSGVGLAMVRHIVAAHGGAITLASKSGHGSTFTMLLPALERT